jgi:hypothetical protein
MTVYSGPVFDMAVNQFGVIANHLSIPMDERDRLLLPKRAITVSCPIHRDDGEVTRREYHILDRAFDQMVMRSKADKVSHRTAGMAIGVEKVRAAKNTRGLFP